MNRKLQNSLHALALCASLSVLALMAGTSPAPVAPAALPGIALPSAASVADSTAAPVTPVRSRQRHSLVMPYFSFSPRG